MKKRQFLLSLLLAAFFALAGCFSSSSSSDDDDDAGNGNGDAGEVAELRAYHASPDAGPVDIYVGGELVLEEVGFPLASPYLEVPADELTVQVVPAGGELEDAVIDQAVTPSADGRYSFIVWGSVEAGNLDVAIISDLNDGVADGFVKLRPAHLAVGAPAVDLYLTTVDADLDDAEPAATDLAFGDIADEFLEVAAETSRIRVTVSGTTDVVYDYVAELGDFPGVSMLAAAVNTDQGFSPILIGAATDVGAAPFLPLIDQQSEVRVAHGSPDAGPVDVEVSTDEGDSWIPLVEGLSYFEHTGYVRVLGELDYLARVLDADGNVVGELDLSPEPGNAYSVFALGEAGAGSLTFLPTLDRSGPVSGDDFAIRAVHGIIPGPTVDVEADGGALIEELSEGEASDFAEAAAGTYSVAVVTSDGGDPVIGPLDLEFDAGSVYTVVALPESEEGDEEPTPWLIVDREAD
ncbi:DUF4397 domain-containing protein [Gammaproteobacteria bacterium AB-CW1]|uniref:DUF4397 domain-containing protein n=1 Tax=Natronospira elongata TaxID=3110268 RepID=A0AAP6JDF5_9GAMM|nr:DUF4397 domain-containing protein [Gammaproteobacteria bacterium AB-CW1]